MTVLPLVAVPKSGLVHVYRQVERYFIEYGVGASVIFGWKAAARTDKRGHSSGSTSGFRVDIVPSDPVSGKAGPVTLAVKPGPVNILNASNEVVGRVRPLRQWERVFTVTIWAVGSEVDELDLVEETETLFEWVVRAFQAAVGGLVSWGEPSWTVDAKELTNGRKLVVPGVLKTVLYDVPHSTTHPSPVVTGEFVQPT